MKIAVISDIHANLAALQQALDAIRQLKPDKIVCLGDIVGYGPRPNECVDLVRENCQVCLMGNHDHAVLGLTDTYYFNQYAREAINWTRRMLTIGNKAYLENLQFSHYEGEILYVHSTPEYPEEWHYILSEYEAKKYLERIKQKICFIGHSHIPVIFSNKRGTISEKEIKVADSDEKYIVNVGSIGQPRDGDHRLCFVFYDTESRQLRYIRKKYPVQETYDEILANQLPPFLAMRLLVGH
ncbi:MAG: metallophosphoesterase family protein [Calditrichaeota bacterium]|nr:metallophosphoesterase family protein [Calditrichota bacterium]